MRSTKTAPQSETVTPGATLKEKISSAAEGVAVVSGIMAVGISTLAAPSMRMLEDMKERGIGRGQESRTLFADPSITATKLSFDRLTSPGGFVPRFELVLEGLNPGSYTIEGTRIPNASPGEEGTLPGTTIFHGSFEVDSKGRSVMLSSDQNFNAVTIERAAGQSPAANDTVFFSLNGELIE